MATTPATRTPEQIRASIEHNRQQLSVSLVQLRAEVTALTDWRRQLTEHRREALIGAAVAGFVIGGGIAGMTGVLFGRRRRKRRR
jgi:hypothetical protein